MGGEVIAIYIYIYIYIDKLLRSTMSLQFSDFLVLSLALSVVPATSSDVNKWILVCVAIAAYCLTRLLNQ